MTTLDPETERHVRALDSFAADKSPGKSRTALLQAAAHMRKLATDRDNAWKVHKRSVEKLGPFMQARYERGVDPEAVCGDHHGDVAVAVITRLEHERDAAQRELREFRDEVDAGFRKLALTAGPRAVEMLVEQLAETKAELERLREAVQVLISAVDECDQQAQDSMLRGSAISTAPILRQINATDALRAALVRLHERNKP